jgi:hypothetical protein
VPLARKSISLMICQFLMESFRKLIELKLLWHQNLRFKERSKSDRLDLAFRIPGETEITNLYSKSHLSMDRKILYFVSVDHETKVPRCHFISWSHSWIAAEKSFLRGLLCYAKSIE